MRWFIAHRIGNMARKHSNVFHYGNIWPYRNFVNKNNMDWLIQDSNYNRKYLSELGENDDVIYIAFCLDVRKPSPPVELYAIFESFLFLREQKLSYNVAAIAYGRRGGGLLVTITWEELERLYDLLDSEKDNRSETAKELAHMWADENLYSRRGLILSEENKYRRELVTIWNGNIRSNDNNFELVYTQRVMLNIDPTRKNNIMIWELDYWKDWEVPAKRVIKDIDIEETGFAYASWDEYDNVWVYGETVGLLFLKFDGDRNWEFAEIGDEEIPYPIQKVIEVKNE